MRLALAMSMFGVVGCSCARPLPAADIYFALLRDDGQTWCAYRDPKEFEIEATSLKPTESARLTYTAGNLAEVTHQIEAESGDWIVIDTYSLTDAGAVLRRSSLLTQANRRVIQEATVRGDRVEGLRVVRVSTLDGTEADLPAVDLPLVRVQNEVTRAPFVEVVAEMQRRSLGRLCRSVNTQRPAVVEAAPCRDPGHSARSTGDWRIAQHCLS